MTAGAPGSVRAPSRPPSRRQDPGIAAVVVAVAGLLLVFASGLTRTAWSCFPDPALAGDLVWLTVIGAALVPRRTPATFLCAATLALAAAVVIEAFLDTLGGRLLFGDDHSTFFYRVSILADRFPDLTYYDAGWNAGRLTTEVFPTGAILLYLLAAPVLTFFSLESTYNVLIGTILFALCPLMIVLAARALGLGWRAALVAGAFALAPSLMVPRWGFKYGAVPFVVVSYASPLIYALARRVVASEGRWWLSALALVVLLSLALLWSGSVFSLAPVGLAAFVEPRASLVGWMRIAGVALVVAVTNSWWILEYVNLVPVFDFVSKADALSAAPLTGGESLGWGKSVTATLSILQKTNPILIGLLPIAFVDRERRPMVTRLVMLSIVLLVLAVVGPQLGRHLELDRLSLPMSLCLSIVAAVGVQTVWRASAAPAWPSRIGRGLVLAVLSVTILAARGFAENESIERYSPMGPTVRELVAQVREHQRGGRTYIAGFVLHEFSDGHAAALQRLTGVQMVTIEPAHRFWRYQDPLPPQFRDGSSGFHRFLDLLNVDQVITKDRAWRLRLENDPAFERVWAADRFVLFRYRKAPLHWMVRGAGTVEYSPNRLRVKLESDEAVLRYRWWPGLEAANGTVESVEIDGLPWIGVRGKAGEVVEVSYP